MGTMHLQYIHNYEKDDQIVSEMRWYRNVGEG